MLDCEEPDEPTRSVQPALHLLRERLHPRVDLLEPRDALVGVPVLLKFGDPRLEVRVELLQPLLDLLCEVDAGLRGAARAPRQCFANRRPASSMR